MAINAHEINGPDPGAVPGGSTMTSSDKRMGPKQDRRTRKGAGFRPVGYRRTGPNRTIANDNRAPVALAA